MPRAKQTYTKAEYDALDKTCDAWIKAYHEATCEHFLSFLDVTTIFEAYCIGFVTIPLVGLCFVVFALLVHLAMWVF